MSRRREFAIGTVPTEQMSAYANVKATTDFDRQDALAYYRRGDMNQDQFHTIASGTHLVAEKARRKMTPVNKTYVKGNRDIHDSTKAKYN